MTYNEAYEEIIAPPALKGRSQIRALRFLPALPTEKITQCIAIALSNTYKGTWVITLQSSLQLFNDEETTINVVWIGSG